MYCTGKGAIAKQWGVGENAGTATWQTEAMYFKISGEISGVKTIAQGSSIRCLGRLQKAYGIGNWKKKKGLATVVFEDGTSARVEVHWYEAHGIGKMEMKIKEFI